MNKEKTMKDYYTVDFRIESETLNSGEVTRLLNLEPSQTNYANNKDISLWVYNGELNANEENPTLEEWENIEDGLVFLLEKLMPKKEIILSNFKEHKRFFWCGYFQRSLNGGAIFSPKLLKKLAEFETEVIIRNYICNE